jgi:L-fuculose-phosphate aldolase
MHMPKIGVAAFATPGSVELGRLVAESLADADVALMQNHGVIAVAKTLYKAFDHLESIETFSKVTFAAGVIAGGGHTVRPRNAEQLRTNEVLRGRA